MSRNLADRTPFIPWVPLIPLFVEIFKNIDKTYIRSSILEVCDH